MSGDCQQGRVVFKRECQQEPPPRLVCRLEQCTGPATDYTAAWVGFRQELRVRPEGMGSNGRPSLSPCNSQTHLRVRTRCDSLRTIENNEGLASGSGCSSRGVLRSLSITLCPNVAPDR
jgi:hypothetical protein